MASGIGLFNESILAERGFSAETYYQTLVVTALTALAGNFLGGWLAARVPLGRLMAMSLFILAAGLAALPQSPPCARADLGDRDGARRRMVMVLFFSVWPRVFGRRHLGRIQGAAQALTVLASAVGPLLLAWCVEWTGSYAAMFGSCRIRNLALVPDGVGPAREWFRSARAARRVKVGLCGALSALLSVSRGPREATWGSARAASARFARAVG